MKKLFYIISFTVLFFQGIAQENSFGEFTGDRSGEITKVAYWDNRIIEPVIKELLDGKTVLIKSVGDYNFSVNIVEGNNSVEFATSSISGGFAFYLEDQGEVFNMAEILEYDFDSDGINEIIIIESCEGVMYFSVYYFENDNYTNVGGIYEGTLEIDFYENYIKFLLGHKYKYNKNGFEKIRE